MGVFVINIFRKSVTHIRSWVKILAIMTIAGTMIAGLLLYIYKPTYSVSLNGEFVGYTQDKSKLQAKINSYIASGDSQNVAFIQVDNMPEYELCLLKGQVETKDEEIYKKVISQGTTYYRYYALLDDGEEKFYFSNFEQAEDAVNKLKDKDSANADDLTVEEKYSIELKGFTEVETCVAELYEKKIVKVVTTAKSSGGSGIGVKGMNNTSNVVDLGITLVKPVSGTITSRYGWRSRDNHKGLDIGTAYGTSIYAAAAGTVTTSAYGYNGGYGNYVIISHGNGVQTLYGHCSSLCVSEGEYVSQGQLVAKVGSTGISTGNHLHFEVRVDGIAQDPQNYVY